MTTMLFAIKMFWDCCRIKIVKKGVSFCFYKKPEHSLRQRQPCAAWDARGEVFVHLID